MRESVQKLKNKFNKFRTEKGFTLIELMAVLVILALIVMIAVPAVGNMIEKAKVQSAESNVELIENAAEMATITGDYTGAYTAVALEAAGYLKVDKEAAEKFDDEYSLTQTGNSGQYEATKKVTP